MPYLFYGPDTFSISKKIEGLKARFLKSDTSGLNFFEIDGEKTNEAEIISTICAAPFLAEKRLIIIKNFLLFNKDEGLKKKMVKIVALFPASSVVFFIELGIPDKRTAFFKALNQKKFSQFFPAPQVMEIKQFIKEKIRAHNISIQEKILERLAVYLSPDYYQAENETFKLINYLSAQKRNEILDKDIELLIHPQNFSNIFEFLDALGIKNGKTATLALDKLTSAGENELYILTMIIYQFRNLLLLEDLKEKELSKEEIVKITKLHPYVVAKTLNLLKIYKKDSLAKIYHRLEKIDSSIKSGDDKRISLDLFVASTCI